MPGVYRYDKESGRADAPNTSCLSPYLHFGQLSPRWLLWDAKGARCRPPKFQRKLAWRDLAYWQLTLFPDLPWESLRPPYKVKTLFKVLRFTFIESQKEAMPTIILSGFSFTLIFVDSTTSCACQLSFCFASNSVCCFYQQLSGLDTANAKAIFKNKLFVFNFC